MAAMSIGDAARATGVPAWKLRAWEARGLLSPQRAPNGFRVFDLEDLVRVRELETAAARGNRLTGFANRVVERPAPTATTRNEAEPRPRQSAPRDIGTGMVKNARSLAWTHLMHVLRSTSNHQDVLDACLDAVLIASEASIGSIDRADPTRNELVTLVDRGLSDTYMRKIRNWQLHEGLAGRAYSLREPVVARDLMQHHGASRVSSWQQELRGYLCVPMLLGAKRLGVIEVFSGHARDFGAEEIEAVEELATFIASVIEQHRTVEELELLRSQRGAFTRRWTAQWSIATQAERERIASLLQVALDAIEHEELGQEQVIAVVRNVVDGVRAAERAVVDSESLIRDQIRSHLTGPRSHEVKVEFDTWPELLPLEFATRHALAIGQMVGRIGERFDGPFSVLARGEAAELLVELAIPTTSAATLEELVERETTARGVLDELGASYRLLIRDDTRVIRIGVVPPPATPFIELLSPREHEVLSELGSAKSNAQLAADFGISAKTLQNHLTAIYRKLDVGGRVEAVAMLTEPGGR